MAHHRHKGAAGLNAAKIAAIALHTALWSMREEVAAARGGNSLLGVGTRCSGPPISLFTAPGTRPDGPQRYVMTGESR